MRKLKNFTHIYHVKERLYVVSLHDQIDVIDWIDRRMDDIRSRVSDYSTNTDYTQEGQQTTLFA